MIHWFFLNYNFLYTPLYFLYKRISEPEQINWIRKTLREGMVAVDIGANIGFHSLLFSKIVKDTGKVYSFEPERANFNFLQKNTKGVKNISLHNVAVSDKTGKISLFLSKNLNVDHRTYQTEDTRSVQVVPSISLDNFFKQSETIDLIKIDIQGFDYFAIKGAQNLIKKQKSITILGEFWPYGLKRAGVKSEDYLRLLKQLNLKVILKTSKSFDELKDEKGYYTNFVAFK